MKRTIGILGNSSGIFLGFCLSLIFLFPIFCGASVANWGDNLYGQSPSNTPSGLNGAKAIAAGYWHNLAVKYAGGIVAWGLNSFGQIAVPSFLVNPSTQFRAVAVSAGHDHSLALYGANRIVIGWGDNSFGQTNIPMSLSNVTAIAAGGFHNAALKADGTVVAWGYNFYGQTDVPVSATNVVAIACGNAFTLALRGDGVVIGWGDDFYNQTEIPPDLTNVVAIAAGFAHGLAVRSNGTVVSWGDDSLGQGVPPPDLTNAVAVAAGFAHSLALKSDGSIVSWGDNSSGQTNVQGNLSHTLAVSAGYGHSLALKDDKPFILSQPQSVSVAAGSSVTFGVSVTGITPFAYKWYLNATNLLRQSNSSSTTNFYTLLNVTTNNAGRYHVTVTNFQFGLAVSETVVLAVDGYGGFTSPVILTNPASKTVNLGGAATFSVVADGTQPFSYQWQLVGTNQPTIDLPDATNAFYTLSNALATDAGGYQVVVTNLGGTTTSGLATLTVRLPPTITNQPVDVTTNQGATVSFSVGASGYQPMTYQWWFNNTNQISAASTFSLLNVTTNASGTYFAVVTSIAGMATSRVATLTVLDNGSIPSPVIMTNPINLTINLGGNATFYALAAGTPPLDYRWQFVPTNQPIVDLPDSTNNTYAIVNARIEDGGGYRMIVTNMGGSATSSIANLIIRLPPTITSQPVDVTTNVGANVRFAVVVSSSTSPTYRWMLNNANIGGNSSSLIISNVQPNQAGSCFVIVTNSVGTVTSQPAALSLFSLPSQTPAQLFASTHPGSSLLYLTVAFEAGKNYRIQTSTNLADWHDLTNFVSTAPVMEFSSAQATNSDRMYFRVISP